MTSKMLDWKIHWVFNQTSLYTYLIDFFFFLPQDVVVHSLVLAVEIFIGILLVCSCFNRRVGMPVDTTSGGATVSGSVDQNIENSSNTEGNSSSVAVLSYQRRHSHEEKSTNLDRPYIEEIKQRELQRRSSLDRKTFLSNSKQLKWNSALVTQRLIHCLPNFFHLEVKQ
jgi:hypothetical protein